MACFTRLALGRYLGTLPLKCSPGIRLFGLSGLLDTCFLLGIWKFSSDGRSSCLGDQSESESRSDVSDSLRPHGLYSPWNSPDQNTGVGSLFLPQGIFPTQELNPGLPHCRQILYQLSHKGSDRGLI